MREGVDRAGEAATPPPKWPLRRRGLVAAAAAATAAWFAGAAPHAEAADEGPLLLGRTNTAASMTRLDRTGAAGVAQALLVTNSNGDGVRGVGRTGVVGFGSDQAVRGEGGEVGVDGHGSSVGVRGGGGLVGVRGGAGLFGHVSVGVLGTVTTARSFGVVGRVEHPSGGVGVLGVGRFDPLGTAGPTGIGVAGTGETGVVGQSAGADGTGVAGWATGGGGVAGASRTGPGVMGASESGVGVLGSAAAGLAGLFHGPVVVNGPLTVTGPTTAAVVHPDGSPRRVYAQESPDPWLEDFGVATLAGGAARVALAADFAALVLGGDYLVYLTPRGDSNGLYVSRQDAGGFEVREQRGGTSSLAFNYRVVARRADAAGGRLERLQPPEPRPLGAGAPAPKPPRLPDPPNPPSRAAP